MDMPWNKIQALRGQSLATTCNADGQAELFTVVEVSDESVKIEVGPEHEERTIHRRQFQAAYDLGLFTPDAIPQQLTNAKVALGRTSYAAAIIQESFD